MLIFSLCNSCPCLYTLDWRTKMYLVIYYREHFPHAMLRHYWERRPLKESSLCTVLKDWWLGCKISRIVQIKDSSSSYIFQPPVTLLQCGSHRHRFLYEGRRHDVQCRNANNFPISSSVSYTIITKRGLWVKWKEII